MQQSSFKTPLYLPYFTGGHQIEIIVIFQTLKFNAKKDLEKFQGLFCVFVLKNHLISRWHKRTFADERQSSCGYNAKGHPNKSIKDIGSLYENQQYITQRGIANST